MTLTDFISKVRLVLDMDNSTALISAGDTDAAYLDAIIEGNAVPAAKEIVSVAPARMLVPGTGATSLTATLTLSNGVYVGSGSLPSDFYRLLAVKMKSWERPARIIYDDDAEYALQKSRWPGLRGNAEDPVAVLVKDGSDCGYKLETYASRESTDTLEYCRYCPVPAITSVTASSTKTLAVPSKLTESIVYACASLTAETFGNASLAERYMSHAYRLAEITTKNTDNNGDKEQ
jgi:hypothetical protein